jgi:hypothetical protein
MKKTPTRPRFGPFMDVREKDIEAAGWNCRCCAKPIEKLMKFVPSEADFLCVYACGCTNVVCWELEGPPNGPEHWLRLTKLQKASGTDIVALTPKAAISLHRSGNREGIN